MNDTTATAPLVHAFNLWFTARAAEDQTPWCIVKHRDLLLEAYMAGARGVAVATGVEHVTALRAALEQAVQTCRECDGHGVVAFLPAQPSACPQCESWRALLAAQKDM